MQNPSTLPIETHPFPPFVPTGARVLMLGTFPPKPNRWAMEFFYPNRTNDMWKIMGLIFFGNPFQFYDAEAKTYRLLELKHFLKQQRIALYDTATRVRRLKDNASDKFLDIMETIDLTHFLSSCPTIQAVVTAGEKATGVVAQMAGVQPPKMGEAVECVLAGHLFTLYRMPSSSRAFPMALDKKAEAYRKMFRQIGYDISK
ncbi:MAG: uracil-DNA glycosylase family protein [Sodaliphilus sp.]